MTGYGLECSTPFFIAAFGQAYFIGYAISGLIAPPLMDKYGRKRAYAISRVGQMVLTFLLLVMPQGPDHFNATYGIITIIFFVGL